MRNPMCACAFVVAALLGFSTRATAQVTETQVPFDSAGKVHSLTPALVDRYQLTPPVWPVAGEFSEARLYRVSTGGLVLAVERRSGTLERHTLSESEAAALRSAVDAALVRTGAAVAEGEPETLSSPASGAFVRNQMILSWVLYGPLLASLANDGRTASALYLLSVSSSYFITSGINKKGLKVTRAQNHLATDGAFRGWGAVSGLLYAAAGDSIDGKVYRGLGLAGALGGAAAGFVHGRRLTDSEAKAATTGSSFAALTTLGVAGTLGVFNDSSVQANRRATIGASVGAGIAGYLLGPKYPRTTRYSVTTGDIQLLWLSAILGVMVTTTPIVDSDVDPPLGWGLSTAGFLGGIVAGDRLLVKPFDHTTSDAFQIILGAVAGGVAGSAVDVMIRPGDVASMAIVTAGAIGGTIAGHRLVAPARAGGRPAEGSRRFGAATIELDPMGLALGAARVPGRHALVSVRF